MTGNNTVPAPTVMWAQRANLVLLTICLEDVKNPEIKVEAGKLYFKGVGGTEKKLHEVTINFFKDIDTEKSKFAVRERVIEFALEKKEVGFWDRLVSDKVKHHWLKLDFARWKDEDESEGEEENGQDLEAMMRNMGGLGGVGDADMGDLSKVAGKMERPSLDDLVENDSDEEDLPELD